MSDLTTGGAPDFPANWGFPSNPYNYCTGEYTTCGMIWYGTGPATIEDVIAVKEDPRSGGNRIDRGTLCGTDDPDWITEAEVLLTQPCYKQVYKPGG
jgi:hypothetical protein